MKRTLAIILAILFMLPVYVLALDFPPELDHGAAVKRIENAKIHWVEKREPSDADTSQIRVVIDDLDLYNSGNLSLTQRLVIINEDPIESIAETEEISIPSNTQDELILDFDDPEVQNIKDPIEVDDFLINPEGTVLINPEYTVKPIEEKPTSSSNKWLILTFIIIIIIMMLAVLAILSK